ncbi:MAG: apolipoprotein N-acyltransferase [Puniceicoccales bacterium]|jgi:apolipoprotein N-acyltransferase|nr:apolipoprotein N-acyltransferase [Puniceicoccales bacterium]
MLNQTMLHWGNSYRALRALPWVVGLITAVAYVICTPGFDIFQMAWLWAIPMLLWSTTKPTWKSWLLVSFFAIWAAKIAILIWLRHIYPPLGWIGLVLATAYFTLYPLAWLAFVRWLFPRTVGAAIHTRLVIQFGLAGAWVLLEWIQSWLFTGCPWVLMADTQWQNPLMLSLCAWGGPWGLSFAIMLFNIGLARTIHRFVSERPGEMKPAPGPLGIMRNLSPELYVGVIPVLLAFVLFFRASTHIRSNAETLFTMAAVQTDFDPNAKWDPEQFRQNANTVRTLTLTAAQLSKNHLVYDARDPQTAPRIDNIPATPPQLILWPEAALPFHVGESNYDEFLTEIAKSTASTLLIGAVSRNELGYYNGIYSVTGEGVSPEFYAKRHLVPFGEYVPFAKILPLRKIVPVAEDSLVGERDFPLPVSIGSRVLLAGPLVCYEDIFPAMSREMALLGADFIVVVTNDAWYGREAGAYQHASHCAVMAASLHLPVIRCGNNGWSGVFNPLGYQQSLKDASGSVYFQGAGWFEVTGVSRHLRQPTFYMQHGDWMVTMSGFFTLWAYLRNRRWRRKKSAESV